MAARGPREILRAAARALRLSRPVGASSPPLGAAAAMLELARSGPAPLRMRRASSEGALRIAAVIPSFRRGSGGHRTIVRLLQGLSALGHEVSIWLDDHEGRHAQEQPALTRRSFGSFFGAGELTLHTDLQRWEGADVVLATGWQTVARALLLPDAAARAYLVQDHEPDFYPASAEAVWAAQTYRLGLHCIAASEWLAQLLRKRYGASATHFDLGADREVYRPSGAARRDDLVVFYARASTPRRAVPLGLAALSELAARRPQLAIELFGEGSPPRRSAPSGAAPFRSLGVLGEHELAELYSRATVGMVLSLTNPSLIGLEMTSCGLPCVELASDSMTASFHADGPLQLAEPEPLQLCAAIERLLDDPALRARLSEQGVALTAERSWRRAAEQVQAGVRQALAAALPERGPAR